MASNKALMVNPATGVVVAPVTTITLDGLGVNSVIDCEGINTGLDGEITMGSSSAVALGASSTITIGGVAVPTISSTVELTNKTINGASNTITNVSLTTGITGTLSYTNGGTSATTQAGARTNLGGERYGFADGAAVLAATPEYIGQHLLALDGYWGVARGTTAGAVNPFAVVTNGATYFLQDTAWNGFDVTISGGEFSATTTSGVGHLFGATGTFTDNPINVFNTSGGYASVATYRPADGTSSPLSSASGTFGYGPGTSRGSPGLYNDRVYIGLAPKTSPGTADLPDLVVGGEGNKGFGFMARELMLYDGVGKTWTFRGWSDGSVQGPMGLHIAATGNVGIGTNSLATNAELTVNGDIAVGNGSTTTGSIHFNGDPNTGLYRVSADVIALIAGGNATISASPTSATVDIGTQQIDILGASVFGTNDLFFQGKPGSGSAYTVIEDYQGAGLVLGTGTAVPVLMAVNRVEVARQTGSGLVQQGFIQLGTSGPQWFKGTGSPEGVVVATRGSFYSRTDGGAGSCWYVKESDTTSTGWAAK